MSSTDNYIKISVPFMRDVDGNKKLVEGHFVSRTMDYLKDNTFEWTEKIDGGCTCVRWDGHRVTFEGHDSTSDIPGGVLAYLKSKFDTPEAEELFEQSFGETPVEIYGEGYGAKIQKPGNLYRDDQSFIVFDVYMPKTNYWIERKNVYDIAKEFGVDSVPVIMTGTLNEAIAFVKTQPMSTIGTAPMEGLVGRPLTELFDRQGHRIIVKVKCRDFCEGRKR